MEPIRTFDEILAKIHDYPVKRVAIACADLETVLTAAALAEKERVADAILVGDRAKTEAIAAKHGLDLSTAEFVDEPDPDRAAATAVGLVARGEADIAMKGLIHTDDFLRAVLQREGGLRTGRLLSHAFLLEVRHMNRILLVTDAAMNIAPNFEEKAQIARNAMELARLLDIEVPRVAVLAATELVVPKMQATQDAAILALMSARGQFEGGIVEGPFALDNAVSELAASVKGIRNPVAGKADVLLVPDLEAGNILAKSFVYFARGRVAGVLLGAKAPVVITSRADSSESMFLSIATAVYMANIREIHVKIGRRV